MTELHFEDALTIGRKLQQKELTSVELTQSMLQRIEAHHHLRAFVTVTEDHALQQAKKADAEIQSGQIRSSLHGVPIALKDLLATRGVTTTNGMSVYFDNVPNYDATVVSRLQNAGTVMLGKTQANRRCFCEASPEG